MWLKQKIWSYILYSRVGYLDTLNINWFYCKIREELVELNKQTIATQAKKAQELIANQVVYVEVIKMMGWWLWYIWFRSWKRSTKEIGEVYEKWLSESKNRIKLTYIDARKNQFILKEWKPQKLKAICKGILFLC